MANDGNVVFKCHTSEAIAQISLTMSDSYICSTSLHCLVVVRSLQSKLYCCTSVQQQAKKTKTIKTKQ